jgi:hypothetical protein
MSNINLRSIGVITAAIALMVATPTLASSAPTATTVSVPKQSTWFVDVPAQTDIFDPSPLAVSVNTFKPRTAFRPLVLRVIGDFTSCDANADITVGGDSGGISAAIDQPTAPTDITIRPQTTQMGYTGLSGNHRLKITGTCYQREPSGESHRLPMPPFHAELRFEWTNPPKLINVPFS